MGFYYGILGKGVEQHEVLSSAFDFCFFRLSFTYIQMREVLRLGGFGNGGLSRGLTLKYSNWFLSPLSPSTIFTLSVLVSCFRTGWTLDEIGARAVGDMHISLDASLHASLLY
jgi:hypothetical protein